MTLTWLASHLALPKSSTSVLVKDLERRDFVRRTRDETDERRLAIVLTDEGRNRVEADTVLEPAALAAALEALDSADRKRLLDSLERLVSRLPERARGRAPA